MNRTAEAVLRPAVLWPAIAGYMGVIFYLSSQPNPLPELTATVNDKLLHGPEYAILAALFCAAFRTSGFAARTSLMLAVLCASVYGATDELHQSFVPGRNCATLDWAADAIGSTVGGFLAAKYVRMPSARKPSRTD